MPLFDRRCPACLRQQIDCLEPSTPPIVLCECGQETERVWLSKAPFVIGDEIDISVRHGLCHADGTPQRFRSRQELAREAKRRGFTNFVEHHGAAGSDKSKHTQKWI